MASACFPRRLCGLCRLPGHNRSNCNIIDLNDSSHVDDGPAGNSIVNRIRRERAERIRANGLKPMTKEEYCMAVYGFTCQDMHDFRREDAPIPLPDRKAVKLNTRERRAMTSQRVQPPAQAPPRPSSHTLAALAPPSDAGGITVSDITTDGMRYLVTVTRSSGRINVLSLQRGSVDRRRADRGQSLEQVVNDIVHEYVNQIQDRARSFAQQHRQEQERQRQQLQEQHAQRVRLIEQQQQREQHELRRVMEESMRNYRAPIAQATGPEPTATEPIEETTCPICMEPLTKTNHIVGKCGHQFHASCLCLNLVNTNACPCCRQQVV